MNISPYIGEVETNGVDLDQDVASGDGGESHLLQLQVFEGSCLRERPHLGARHSFRFFFFCFEREKMGRRDKMVLGRTNE